VLASCCDHSAPGERSKRFHWIWGWLVYRVGLDLYWELNIKCVVFSHLLSWLRWAFMVYGVSIFPKFSSHLIQYYLPHVSLSICLNLLLCTYDIKLPEVCNSHNTEDVSCGLLGCVPYGLVGDYQHFGGAIVFILPWRRKLYIPLNRW
jgi:hypothetical protein